MQLETIKTKLLASARWVAFDVETTGLFPANGRIVEVGAIKFGLDGRIYGMFQQLINPQCTIPADVTRIHGITDAMVCGQPTAAQALPEFLLFLKDADVLLAHNAGFDAGFVGQECTRAGLAAPGLPILDTVAIARRLHPGLRSYRLEAVAQALGVVADTYHRAVADSQAVREIFCRLVNRLPSAGTLAHLLPHSQVHVFHAPAMPETALPPDFEFLAPALREGRPLDIIYTGGRKGLIPRTITPRALFRQGGVLAISAFCHIDRCEKTFRLDRIRHCDYGPTARPTDRR